MVRALLLSFLIAGIIPLHGSSQDLKVDSLKHELKTETQFRVQLRLLNDLIELLLMTEPDSALVYAHKYMRLVEKSGSETDLSRALYNLGKSTAGTGDDSKAITLYRQALDLNIPERESLFISRINKRMGSAYYHLADYDKALESFLAAVKFLDHDSLLLEKAGVLNNIGNVFYFTNKDEAPKYYQQSLDIYYELNDEDGIAAQLGNLGLIYIQTDEYVEAINHCEQSLVMYRKLGNERSMARSQVNLAYAYKEVGNTKIALQYALKSLELRKKLNDVRGIATSTIMIGNIYHFEKNFRAAIPYFEEGIKMTTELGMRAYEYETMESLAQCYAEEGHTDKALELYPDMIAVKASVFNEKSQAQLAEMDAKYETLEKDGQIKLLTKEAEISDLQLRRREVYLGAAAVVAFLLGIIALFIFFAYRNKEKTNLVLGQKNQEIEEKSKHITQSIKYAKRLQSAILPKDETFAQHFKAFHILYLPKDIVSGDFYWMEEVGDLIFLAAADCTGHGVPGAMVSMIGFQGLRKAVLEDDLTSPSAILQRVSDHVEEAFEKSQGSIRDGLDICLCAFNLKNRRVVYAGAHNALLVVTEQSEMPNALLRESSNGLNLFEFKADRRSIGGFMDSGPFTDKEMMLLENDRLFLFSDGYADQFGGPRNKKFGSKRMRETIMEACANNDISSIDSAWKEWSANEEQIDDVTLISVTA